MKSRLLLILIAGALTITSLPALSQTTANIDWSGDLGWTKLYDAGLEALVTERFANAADTFGLAVERARSYKIGDTRLLLSLERLAETYKSWNRLEQVQVIETEIASLRNSLTPSFGEVNQKLKEAQSLFPDAWAAYSKHDYKTSLALGLRGFALAESLGLTSGYNAAACATIVGASLVSLGKSSEGLTWYLKTVAIAATDSDARALVQAITNVGSAFEPVSREKLVPVLESCCKQAEGPSATPDSIRIAAFRVYELVGKVMEDESNWKQAEEYYSAALSIAESIGPKHQTVGTALNSLGTVYLAQNRLDEAEKCFNRALKVFSQFSKAHPSSTATSLYNLGVVAYRRADYFDADTLLSRSLELMTPAGQESQPNYTTTQISLALVALRLGFREKGRRLAQAALTLDSIHQGARHPDVARDLSILAGLNSNEGRYLDAELQFRKAIEIAKEAMPHDPAYAEYLNAYAAMLRMLYREKEAKEYEAIALEVRPPVKPK